MHLPWSGGGLRQRDSRLLSAAGDFHRIRLGAQPRHRPHAEIGPDGKRQEGVFPAAGGSKVTVNHLSVGRITNGATVEREVPMSVGADGHVDFELASGDFGTANNMADAINRWAPGKALAIDARRVRVAAPSHPAERVAFLAQIENLEIVPAHMPAKVIVNGRTGSVVMNQSVRLDDCAVAHGNLSVTVAAETSVSQPPAFSRGETVVVQNAEIDLKQEGGSLVHVRGAASLAEVVRALNAIGANPQDLIAILQAMKASGALRAELEII